MNRWIVTIAIALVAGCAAVPADETPPEYSNAQLSAALTRAVSLMNAQDRKLAEQDELIDKLRDQLTSGLNCS